MPTYEYQCDCGERRDKHVPIEARHEVWPCPVCRGFMRLAPSAPVIRFKGDFSGGTSSRYKVHEEQATITEMKKHADYRKRDREQREDRERQKIVGDMVSTYAI